MQRANWFAVSPEGAKAVAGLHHYVTANTGLADRLVHLVFLRVSQINGCAHCIDIHTRDLIKVGMEIETIVLIPVWEEAAYLFSEQERAALAWAEEVTRVSETHASDAAYDAAAAVFSEKELVDLTLTIAAMNAINRMGIGFRMKPRARASQA
ncbi:carboxymuconolactone decarboxylase family protein [Pseudomonadota bacterium AL_CKDN230030165-1A_HGKHYDSX7]